MQQRVPAPLSLSGLASVVAASRMGADRTRCQKCRRQNLSSLRNLVEQRMVCKPRSRRRNLTIFASLAIVPGALPYSLELKSRCLVPPAPRRESFFFRPKSTSNGFRSRLRAEPHSARRALKRTSSFATVAFDGPEAAHYCPFVGAGSLRRRRGAQPHWLSTACQSPGTGVNSGHSQALRHRNLGHGRPRPSQANHATGAAPSQLCRPRLDKFACRASR
jgi:hypothetical protein